MKMEKVTVFRNFIKVIGYRSVGEIVKGIQQGVYMDEIGAIRRAVDRGDKKLADGLKKQLLAVTFSGCFEGGRSLQALKVYYPLIVLDVDGLKDFEEAERIRDLAVEVAYTMVAFVSPSGRGCKIVVRTDSSEGVHGVAFRLVSAFYESKLRITIDGSGKDITRLCFMSFDESVKYRENAETFCVNHGKTRSIFESSTKVLKDGGRLTSVENQQAVGNGQTADGGRSTLADLEQENFRTRNYMQHSLFNPTDAKSGQALKDSLPIVELEKDIQLRQCLEFTKGKMEYVEGNRNNFVYLFACNCNREGIGEEVVLDFAKQEFDLPKGEVKQAVRSAYGHHGFEHGVRKDKVDRGALRRVEMAEAAERYFDALEGTPCFPKGVYEKLPSMLQRYCGVFETGRDKDVFLTGAIAVLSGGLAKVSGVYHKKVQYSNVFTFVIAPPATGKSGLKYADMLGMAYEQKLEGQYAAEKEEYEEELELYHLAKAEMKKGKRSSLPSMPMEPRQEVFYILANSSSSVVIQNMKDANGIGVLCETEADTLSDVLKQDWGGYSDLLRKAFHFERVSYSRKMNKERMIIHQPRLSVALSGTPDQVENLIPSASNGLFSRFCFYAFTVRNDWQDVSYEEGGDKGIILDDFFMEASKEVMAMIEFWRAHAATFILTRGQWERLNERFKGLYNEISSLEKSEAASIIKRMSLVSFRIAMLLTAIRYYEEGGWSERLICGEDDFYISQAMVEVYVRHAMFLFGTMKKSRSPMLRQLPNRKRQFFEKLPVRFQRKEAIKIGGALNVSSATVDRWLKSWVGRLLRQEEYGYYDKVDKME